MERSPERVQRSPVEGAAFVDSATRRVDHERRRDAAMTDLGERPRVDEAWIRRPSELAGLRVDRDRDEHEIISLERELMEAEERGLFLAAAFAPRRPERRDRHATVRERGEVRRVAARIRDGNVGEISGGRRARGRSTRQDGGDQKSMAVEQVNTFAERSLVRKYRS